MDPSIEQKQNGDHGTSLQNQIQKRYHGDNSGLEALTARNMYFDFSLNPLKSPLTELSKRKLSEFAKLQFLNDKIDQNTYLFFQIANFQMAFFVSL